MITPTFIREKKLWKQGYGLVAGVDEAGRGPLAGPVVAAAIAIRQPAWRSLRNLRLRDSKTLSEQQRQTFYRLLTENPNVAWATGVVSEKTIDRINILQATRLAMRTSVESLTARPDFLLIDGTVAIDTATRQQTVINGDRDVFSIAAASIIAKVARDAIMKKFHAAFPRYGFDRHKGYGTALHLQNLKTYGPCKIHRKTFWPVSGFAKPLQKNNFPGIKKTDGR